MKIAMAFQRLEGFGLDSTVGEVVKAMREVNQRSEGYLDITGRIGAIPFNEVPRSFLDEKIEPEDKFYLPKPVYLAVCRPILESLKASTTLREVSNMSSVAHPYNCED